MGTKKRKAKKTATKKNAAPKKAAPKKKSVAAKKKSAPPKKKKAALTAKKKVAPTKKTKKTAKKKSKARELRGPVIPTKRAHVSSYPPPPKTPPVRFHFETIEQVEHFSVPPETIYRVWLDAAQHSAFTGSRATSDARPGGVYSAWDGYIQGKHVELVDNERIVQTWRATDFPEDYPDSRLELTLTPDSGGTKLRLRHTSVPKKNASSYADGWHQHYWAPLRAYLAERS